MRDKSDRTGTVSSPDTGAIGGGAPKPRTDTPPLPGIAERARAEAEARRTAGIYDPRLPPEKGGRKGPEPTRFGDWERNGIASDF